MYLIKGHTWPEWFRSDGFSACRFPLKVIKKAEKWRAKAATTLNSVDNRRNYSRIFQWGVILSAVFHILVPLLVPKKSLEELPLQKVMQEVISLNRHPLVVVNARPRTALAQKMVKVPVIREVQAALDSIVIPKPVLGSIEIGDNSVSEAGNAGEGKTAVQSYIRSPELVLLVPPQYPKEAQKKGIEGTVELRILVTENGRVRQVEVIASSGMTSMDQAAAEAAEKTRFRPALKNGKRISMWINYPVRFTLSK